MTYQVFCQVFPAGSWKWTSKEPASIGMRLDTAFRAFAAIVNALPGNASTPLSVVRSHADATANRWGYTWQLGHPIEPAHLWFHVESPTSSGATLQGDTQTYSSGQFGTAKASTFTSSTSNGGYGSYSNSVINSAGLAYIDSTISGATAIGAHGLLLRTREPAAASGSPAQGATP